MVSKPRGMTLMSFVIVLVVVGFFALTTFSAFWTDRAWYRNVGYSEVFSTLLWTRVGLFVATGLVMALVVCLNIVLAFRLRPIFVGMGDPNGMGRYRDAITPIRRWVVLGDGLPFFGGESLTTADIMHDGDTLAGIYTCHYFTAFFNPTWAIVTPPKR